MKNARISTTISQKHAAILKKYTEQYGTQQSVLEHALDNLGNNQKQTPELSPEAQFLLREWENKSSYNIHKDLFLWLMNFVDINGFENFFMQNKTYMAFAFESFYQRPFKDISLKEILDGFVILSKISNWFDNYTYSDDGDYYMLKMYHSMGMNGSKFILSIAESAFDAYGARYESTLSDKTIFVKIYKNN